MFKRNEGIVDRIVRVTLGFVLLPTGLFLLGGFQGSVLGLVATGLGAIALIAGATGVCPTYVPFGISTLEMEKRLISRCRTMAAGCGPSAYQGAGRMCGPGRQPIVKLRIRRNQPQTVKQHRHGEAIARPGRAAHWAARLSSGTQAYGLPLSRMAYSAHEQRGAVHSDTRNAMMWIASGARSRTVQGGPLTVWSNAHQHFSG